MGEGLKRARAAAKATQRTPKELRADYIKDRAPFVRELARYLVEGQATKSIHLQMGADHAREWARVRGTCTPIRGYPTVEEAETALAKWLGLDPLPPIMSHPCVTPAKSK